MKVKSEYQHLPIDTRLFHDIEPDILSVFDNLDQSLDGWLIKSENYQFLISAMNKMKGRVKTIYIDPPFNLESSDQFLYRTNYKDSTWATLLENRLGVSREYMRDDGVIVMRCDHNGNWIARPLMDQIFGERNFRNEISIRRFKKNVMNKEIKRLPSGLDTLLVYSTTEAFSYENPKKEKEIRRDGFWRHMGDSSGQGSAKTFFGKVIDPPTGKHWKYSQDKIDEMIKDGRLILECRNCGYQHDGTKGLWSRCPQCGGDDPQPKYWVEESETEILDSNWVDIYGFANQWQFSTENSEALLKRVMDSTVAENELVMDYFLGSGTTIAVAQKMRRKWIGVEMGEHFWSVVLPRMKKVLAGEQSGISKEVNWSGGGFFKYYELEQYEDTLRQAHYEDADLFYDYGEDPYHAYVFLRDRKLLDAIEIQDDGVTFHPERLYPNIDLAETLSNLTGKWIRRLTPTYVEFEDGERVDLTHPDWRLFKPLIWW